MTEQREWRWVPVSIRMPRDGEIVAIKMMEDGSGDVHYAVGWYSGQKKNWVITANPRPEVKLVAISWVALPN